MTGAQMASRRHSRCRSVSALGREMDARRRASASISSASRTRAGLGIGVRSERGRTTTGSLEPIAGAEASIRLAGALVGGRGAVAAQHLATLPAGEAHEVALGAAS